MTTNNIYRCPVCNTDEVAVLAYRLDGQEIIDLDCGHDLALLTGTVTR